MKTGLLTFHDGLNHGAFMQMFCLRRVASEILGSEVTVLNYKNKQHHFKESICPFLKYRRPSRFFDHWRKLQAFKKDLNGIPLTQRTTSAHELRGTHYDLVLFGSDVIWDLKVFGEFDSVFFGDVNTKSRIAYAASFGSTNVDDPLPDHVAKLLCQFDAISVRDSNSASIVNRITDKKPPIVLDPVFLPESLQPFCSESQKFKCPYILIYGSGFSLEDIALIRQHAKELSCCVVSLGFRNHWADYNMLGVGPLAGLSYFKHAAWVYTSTYHGTIFALRFNKNFWVKINPAVLNKVTSLLDQLSLSERASASFEDTASVSHKAVSYMQVNQTLDVLRKQSVDWLRNALLRYMK